MSERDDRDEGPQYEDDAFVQPEGSEESALADEHGIVGPGDESIEDALQAGEFHLAGPDDGEGINAAFFHEVMTDLADTNFARGWNDPEMYHDFLAWCETSEAAEAIISQFSPSIPSVLVDPDENVRLVGLEARIAAELMRALLEAYEGERIAEFLSR